MTHLHWFQKIGPLFKMWCCLHEYVSFPSHSTILFYTNSKPQEPIADDWFVYGKAIVGPVQEYHRVYTIQVPSARWITQHFCNDCHWFSDGIRGSGHKYGTKLHMLTKPSGMLLHILEAFYLSWQNLNIFIWHK